MAHPQLPALHHALDETERRAHVLAARAGHDRWMQRPAPARWSPSECVQHLVATIDAFVPLVDAALMRAERPMPPAVGPYHPDLMGRVLLWAMEPPYRIATKTGQRFVPVAARAPDQDLADLVARHEAWRARMRRASGYRLDAIRVASPFMRHVRYSLFTTFSLVPVHERRHLWQAEQTLA